MSLNLLAINVGNTRSHLGVFLNNDLDYDFHVSNVDLANLEEILAKAYKPLMDIPSAGIYIASVNDNIASHIDAAVLAVTDRHAIRIEKEVPVPIGRLLDPESIIGTDRLLNAAAAYDKIKQACIVVDAGTALTVDFIDGDGTFHGGAILPGTQLMLNSLHEHTSLLPQITLTKPGEIIGHNTAQAMLNGAFYGIRGAVREIIEKYAEFYGAYPSIIATGGDAPLLFDDFDLIEKIVPALTLYGIAVTHRSLIDPHDSSDSSDPHDN